MKYIATLITFLGCIIFAHSVQAAWYDSAWDYRIEIQSDQTLVGSTESNMPLYLDLSILGSDFFNNIKNDGSDIIITESDEVTPLDYELVSLDIGNETGEIHFKSDTISDSADTSYYIYYGNNGTNPFIPSNIWNDYRGVWHFEDDINGDDPENLGVATLSAIDGGDGGWAVLFGDNPIGTNLNLAIDEDQVGDTDRAHTTEQVSYWIFEDGIENIVNSSGDVIGEVGITDTIGANISSVSFNNAYTNPVVVVTPNYISGVPAVARIDNLDTNGFDTFLQNPTPSTEAGTPDNAKVYYIVLESGSHILPGNIPVEAGSVTITGVNNKSNYNNTEMVQITPLQSYSAPAVLGSIQTNNNTQWQTFWASDGNQMNPPTGSNIYVGRQTGEELTPAVVDETIGYIIVQAHAENNGGFESRAALGVDTIAGVASAPPYAYPGLTGSSGGILGFTDSTVNNFNTSLIGDISSTAGQLGIGSDFSGSSSRAPISGLTYSNNNSLNELTASFWVNTSDTARSGIFDFDRSEHWQLGLNFHNASGQQGTISFDTASSTNGIQDLNSSTMINDGDWHHVVAVFDEADPTDKKIYIDGQLDVSVNQHTGSLGTGVTRYGIFGDGSEDGSGSGTSNNLPFEGFLDEARIQHRAVSAGWIETSYNNQSNNATFWIVNSPEQENNPPAASTNLFFNHTTAQTGLSDPIDLELGTNTPYFSAIYNGDGDTATRAYIQVTTDPTFTTINYWDSGWFDLSVSVNDGDRSNDLEYDGGQVGASSALLSLTDDDGPITYYWRIAFEDDTGNQGIFSDIATFTFLDTPSIPGNVSATKVEGSPDSFIVNWQDTSTNESRFEVQFRENTGSGFGAWQTVTLPSPSPTPANTTTWPMQNTVNNASYNFRVRACNAVDCSVWREDPVDHFTDPDAPVDVCSEYNSDTDFSITWTNRAIFDESRINQCEDGDCLTETFTTIASNQLEPGPVSSVGTTANSLYRWSVTADNGVVSSEPTYTNIEFTTPSAPTDIEAVRASDTIINLSWTDTSDYEDGYRIYVSIDGGAQVELTPGINTVGENITTYTYTSAEAGRSYIFDVRAHIAQINCGVIINDALLSPSSLSDEVITTPAAPLISSGSYVADDDILVSWLDQSSNEDGFNIYVRENNGPWTLAGSVLENITNFNYTAGSANNVYDFYIESFLNPSLPENPDGLTNTNGPSEFKRVYTAPLAPVITQDNISSTSADVLVIDNASYELGFSIYDETDDSFVQSIASPNITNFNESGLIPNTSYSRYVRSYVENDGVRVESLNSNILNFTTLANSPSDPLVVETTPGVVDVSWQSGGNPTGTEFFIQNIVTGQSSGWLADILSFNESGLNCETLYTYELKARNSDLVETGDEILEITTGSCVNDSSPRSGGSRRVSQERLDDIFNSDEPVTSTEEEEESIEIVDTCSNQTLFTQNMQQGDRDGNYSAWQQGTINEIKKLQVYMNLGEYRSGPIDGIFGPITDSATKRMQEAFKVRNDGQVGPITRSAINDTCNSPHPELTNSVLTTILNFL
ncbi:MAG: fibronectin type III domain-containing protein [Candidatus Pacebacteria bacterium]|nr:fibronectin type III domain-containing protein [Candidatus Paceibacterota bacterium]